MISLPSLALPIVLFFLCCPLFPTLFPYSDFFPLPLFHSFFGVHFAALSASATSSSPSLSLPIHCPPLSTLLAPSHPSPLTFPSSLLSVFRSSLSSLLSYRTVFFLSSYHGFITSPVAFLCYHHFLVYAISLPAILTTFIFFPFVSFTVTPQELHPAVTKRERADSS